MMVMGLPAHADRQRENTVITDVYSVRSSIIVDKSGDSIFLLTTRLEFIMSSL